MKLKNIFKLLAVAGTLALPTTSCSDWLDVKMSDKIMENTLFSTNNGFMTALNGVYMGMIDVYAEDLSLGVIDVMAQYYNMVNGNHNYKVFANYQFNDDAFKNKSNSIWTKMYALVANINGLLVHCDEENSALREEYYPIVDFTDRLIMKTRSRRLRFPTRMKRSVISRRCVQPSMCLNG